MIIENTTGNPEQVEHFLKNVFNCDQGLYTQAQALRMKSILFIQQPSVIVNLPKMIG
jgi:hypothetical protein